MSFWVTSPVAQTQGAPLTLPQMQEFAAQALRDGNPDLAMQVAGGLLQAFPESGYAYFILARANAQRGDLPRARLAASKAYRYAETRTDRFAAAELAAKFAYAAKRPTIAQLWLRRAAQSTDNPQVEEQLARDYGRIRYENPLSFSLRGGVRPSSNINNGSDTELQIIDGLAVFGRLSGAALALSGTIANADATLSYRLRGDKKSRTELTAQIYVQRVSLSEDAKAISPDSRNRDFGSTYGAVSLRHSFAVGKNNGNASVSGTLGQYWSGGDKYYDFARMEVARNWKIGDASRLQLSASVDNRNVVGSSSNDSTVFGLAAHMSNRRPDGGVLSFSFNIYRSKSDQMNSDFTSANLQTRYSFPKQIGPAKISAGVTIGAMDYASYNAGVFVLGDSGREDQSLYADVNLFFAEYDYAGFAPNVTLRVGRKSSNISRFDTRELSLSLGIESKF